MPQCKCPIFLLDCGVERRHGVHGDAAEVEEAPERVEAALLPPLIAVGAALGDAECRVATSEGRLRISLPKRLPIHAT